MKPKATLIETGLIGGLCLSSLHLCWILLVFLGWAQALMDFVFKLHMLNSPFQVQPFSFSLALSLLAITFGVGFFYGLIFFFIKKLFLKS